MAKKVQIEILLNFDRFEENGHIGYEVMRSNRCTKDNFECPYCTESINIKFSVLEEYLIENFYVSENAPDDGNTAVDNFDNGKPQFRDNLNTIVEDSNTEVLKESLLNELYDYKLPNINTQFLKTLKNDNSYEDENEDERSVSTISDSDETCSSASLLNIKYQKEIDDAIESMQIDALDGSSLIDFIEENTIVEETQSILVHKKDIELDKSNDNFNNKVHNSSAKSVNSIQVDPDSTKQSSEELYFGKTQENVIYLCPCNRPYKIKKYFLNHMKQYHPDFSLQDCEYLERELSEDGSKKGRPIHRCPIDQCEKVYWSGRSYRRHMVCCHPDEAKRLNLRAKTYRCQYCKKIYFTSELLNQHLLLHLNPDHYQCSYCSKSFATHNNLKRHINAVHLRIKSYICEVCGVRFNQRYSLKLHHQELHGIDGRYVCNDCGKTYGTKDKLKCHIKWTHHGYGKTECKLCGKTFLVNNYKRHLRDVHKQGRQLEYACRFCKKVFNRRSYRDIHENIHTGEKRFACNICNERFTDPGYRYAHIRRFHWSEFEKRKKRNLFNKTCQKTAEPELT